MDSSVLTEIERLQQAKTDIKDAINNCGVGVGEDELIDAYAAYISAIPSAVLSDLNVDSIGGANSYIKTISLTNGVISATAGGLVSTSAEGLAPAIPTTAPSQINSLDKDWVLTYDDGTLGWRKLPSNAFNNNTYTALKNPTSIKFSDMSGAAVSYDGSSALDLSGGTYNSYQSNRIKVKDTRNDNDYAYLSTDCVGSVSWHFKNSSQIDLPETGYYSGLLHLSPWTDDSGGPEHQLAFNNNGYIYHRLGTGIWSNWKRLAYTSDVLDVKKATTTSVGGVIVSNVLTSAVSLTSANGTTANRYYGVQMDKDGKAFVNVPWVLGSYTLPTASASTLGGIKVGDNLTITNGKLSAVKTQVSIAPDYTSGVKIGSITVDNTSYNLYIPTPASVFVGAKASQAGTSGLVPQPVSGDNTKFLKGDGTWATPTNTWRDIQCDGTSIGANTLNLKAGSNITLSTSNGDITIDALDTRYMDVSTAASGLAPIIPSPNTIDTIDTQASEWVLTSDGGSIPTWKKLPVNAFLNDVTEYLVVSSTANGLMSVALKNKLDSIASNAEVNVLSDWNETKTDSDAFIKNKPTIGSGTITVKVNNSQVGTFNVNQTGATTINIPDTLYAVVSSSANGLAPMPPNSVDSSISSQTNDWVLSVLAGTDPSWKKLPPTAFLNDTVDSAANHYTPSHDSTISATASTTTNPNSTSASWGSTLIVTGVSLNKDSKGHITGISVNSVKMPSNPNQNTWREIKVNGTSLLGSANTTGSINFIAGTNVVLSTEVTGAIKILATDTLYAVVSTAGAGIAPQLNTGITATISTQASELVLTSDGGERPTWKLLPSNAFKDTHYTSKNIVGSSTTSTTNGAVTATTGVYLNHIETNGTTNTVKSSNKIIGSGAAKVTCSSGAITIDVPAATSSALGSFKTGFTTNNTNRNYAVQLESSTKKAFVNVPWIGTDVLDDIYLKLTGGTLTGSLHLNTGVDLTIKDGSFFLGKDDNGIYLTKNCIAWHGSDNAWDYTLIKFGEDSATDSSRTSNNAVSIRSSLYLDGKTTITTSGTGLVINRTSTGNPYIVYASMGTSVGDIGVKSNGDCAVFYNYNKSSWYDIWDTNSQADKTFTGTITTEKAATFKGTLNGTYWKLNNTAANPYLQLIHTYNSTTTNWYCQAYTGHMYLGASRTKSLRINSSGAVLIQGSTFDVLTVKRTAASSGAFIRYTANNQDTEAWSAGMVGDKVFGWYYSSTAGSLGTKLLTLTTDGILRTAQTSSRYAELYYNGLKLYTSGSWASGIYYYSGTTVIGGVGAYGDATTKLLYYYMGASYSNYIFKVTYEGKTYAHSFYESSDRNLKTNILNISNDVLSKIYNIPEVSFNWKKDGSKAFGYIAQDYENISETFVSKDENGVLSLHYTEVLVAQIAALKLKIKELENKISDLA